MRCNGRDVHPAGSDPCPDPGVYRVTTPGDPWPLQYACGGHLVHVIGALGGDCRVTRLEPGQRTPDARSYLDAGTHRLKVVADESIAPGRVEVRTGPGAPTVINVGEPT